MNCAHSKMLKSSHSSARHGVIKTVMPEAKQINDWQTAVPTYVKQFYDI